MTLKLQSPSLVMLCWILAGLITLFAALTYAELAARLAQTGGQYAYLRAIYGPFVGFLFGWASFAVIQSASIASIAYVFAEALMGLLGPEVTSFVASIGGVKFLAIATVAILSMVNFRGLLFGAWVENIFTVLKILGILMVIALAFLLAGESTGAPAQALPEVHPVGWNQGLIGLMFAAMMGSFWAFDGIHNIGFLGGEIKDPQKNIPRALILGVVSVIALYLIVNLAFFQAVSVSQILQIAKEPHKIFAVEMIQQIAGSGWALFVSVLILVSTFGATNGSILSSSRIYFAMAYDRVFFRSIAVTHPVYKTPHRALGLQAVWSSLLILSGTFDELTDLLVFAAFLFYGLGAYGLFLLRKRNVGHSPLLVPSWIPVIYIFFCVALVVVNIWQNPMSSLIGIALILAGIPIYFFVRHREANLQGPN